MKKVFLVLNTVLVIAVLISGFCYMEFGGLLLKGFASFWFVAIGAVNLIFALMNHTDNKKFPLAMLTGLTFSMLGDIFINIDFITGSLVFSLGHVCYFTAYCFLKRFKPTDLIPCGVMFVVSTLILTLSPVLEFDSPVFLFVCLFYGLIISLMLGKAISNLVREKNAITVLLAVGCALFYFSDLMLLFDVFADTPRLIGTLCMLSYYPAQCLLACAGLLRKNN